MDCNQKLGQCSTTLDPTSHPQFTSYIRRVYQWFSKHSALSADFLKLWTQDVIKQFARNEWQTSDLVCHKLWRPKIHPKKLGLMTKNQLGNCSYPFDPSCSSKLLSSQANQYLHPPSLYSYVFQHMIFFLLFSAFTGQWTCSVLI